MIIINKDPAQVIPDICEQDINRKLIISSVNTGVCHFVSYLLKEDNLIYERGCDIKRSQTYICKWQDTFNRNNKYIIELMIKEWHDQTGCRLKYFVVENNKDFDYILNTFNVQNDFKNELIATWNQIQKNNGVIL